MAKKVGPGPERVYAAAAQFVREGLATDGSLFTPGHGVWTEHTAADLHARFVRRPDTSSDPFDVKFERQLAGAPAETIQFAAELLYVHFLISAPSQIGGTRKRQLVGQVLSWSPMPASIPPPLADALDYGLCNAGQAYLQYRPFLLGYLNEFVLAWKRLPAGERQALLGDPWRFKDFTFSIPAPTARIQQHALLHLVFPETFESIVSDKHKRRIVAHYLPEHVDTGDDVDRQLLALRPVLAARFGADFTYYDRPDVRAEWAGSEEEEAPDTTEVDNTGTARVVRYWVEKTLVAGRPDRTDGEWAYGRVIWSPQRARDGRDIYRTMRDVQPGDVVLHFIDNRRFAAVSRVAGEADTTSPAPPGTAWSDGAAIRYALTDFTPLDPPIEREELFQAADVRPRMQEIVAGHRGLFFNRDLELNQGSYLTEAPTALVNLLNDVYQKKAGRELPHVAVREALPERTASQPRQRALTLEWLAEQTLWPEERLLEIVQALQSKSPQVILAGPPGTGKTWIAQLLARYVTQDRAGSQRLVQFHPSYSYEAFVEGLRPVSKNGQIQFETVPGVVLKMVEDMAHGEEPSVLIVDEMNRANLPKVLGELLFLLEYRDQQIDLSLTRGFRLPRNLWFIGTMNTADRSIRSIDVALRRRFDIFECPADPDLLTKYFATRDNRVPSLVEGLRTLNEELAARLDRHHTIGHTFFMANPMTTEEILRVWRRKIGPLIEEYFFDQPDVARTFEPARFWPELAE